METVEISIQRRTGGGKGAARRKLRSTGRVPAVLYGPKRSATSVSVDGVQFERRVGHLEGSHLIRLVSENGADAELHERMVLLREMQRHPVTGRILHADFYEVDLTERLVVSVPLHFTGKAAGVVAGGILQPVMREIEVECLPTEIPESIDVDVTALGIHDAIHLAEIGLPEGVQLVGEATQTVVTVLPPTVEAKPAEAVEAAPEAAATVEGQPAAPETPAKKAPEKSGGEG
jgi:large subunit ribosomal protein L25